MSLQKLHYENLGGTLVRREGLLSWRCPLCKAEGQSLEVMRTCPECGSKEAALPGVQPAPSVPTALLVAAADLVAQMEIVSRVGFVDTPNDKDSCAAFCMAEGTWLELMSCVESLASALAAAPEVTIHRAKG